MRLYSTTETVGNNLKFPALTALETAGAPKAVHLANLHRHFPRFIFTTVCGFWLLPNSINGQSQFEVLPWRLPIGLQEWLLSWFNGTQ